MEREYELPLATVEGARSQAKAVKPREYMSSKKQNLVLLEQSGGTGMGYPVSYRRGAAKYSSGGFQNPLKVPPGKKPGKPANDNWPGGGPANDNDPGGGPYKNPMIRPPEIEFPGYAGAAAGAALRKLIPPQYRLVWDLANDAYSYWPDMTQKPEVPWPNGTFTHACGPNDPPIGYNGRWAWHLIGNGKLCGLGMQALGKGSAFPPRRKSGGAALTLAKYAPSVDRWWIVDEYGGGVSPAIDLIVRYRWTPPIAPVVYPDYLPATVANPFPAMVPAPQGDYLPEYSPVPASIPRAVPRSNPYVRSRPGNRPLNRPDYWPVVSAKPGNSPVVVVAPPTVTDPVRKPPGPGVKERKAKARGAYAWANAALGAAAGVYEDAKFYNDVLNAWYNALPGKGTAKTPIEKALELYRRADEIDVQKAVLGVLWAVAGEKAGAYIDRARRVTGDNLGLNMYITIPTGSAPRV